MGRYEEHYVYDAVGNILEMRHHGSNPASPGWSRTYAYDEISQIENGADGRIAKKSNRLSSTTISNRNLIAENYVYDAHGNIVYMPYIGGANLNSNMHWDYRDQLMQTDLGGGGQLPAGLSDRK